MLNECWEIHFEQIINESVYTHRPTCLIYTALKQLESHQKLIIHEVEYCTCGFSFDALGTQNDLQYRNVVNLRTEFVWDVCDKLLSECSAL